MPTLTIDGKQVTVEKGTRVIQAAKQLGIDIPHYCYHPALSIAGNCRMCLVDIEKTPKLQISCHIECAEGMVVKTNTEKVKQTREHVLEFLLVNHPLDCPVCDQAGECGLQDYYMKHGLYDSRLDEQKIKKKKAVPIGPNVMLDSERCILCSRCVRYSDEITKTNDFGIFNRGDHAEIGLYPGMEFDNKYSGNVVDICPVGALTDRDFRFKARVWYLQKANSVCNGCSRGCNISLEVNTQRTHHSRGERVMRVKPRYNSEINQWWICDEGRYGYKLIDHNRILEPARRIEKAPEILDWKGVLVEVSTKLIEIVKDDSNSTAVLLSPQLSNESLYLARKLFLEQLKLSHVYLFSPNKEGYQDDFLIRSDKNPNRKGAELLGFLESEAKIKKVIELAKQGKLKALYLFGQDLLTLFSDPKISEIFEKIGLTIFHGTNSNLTSEASRYVLPSASYAETSGTFTNFEGKTQRFYQALAPIENTKKDLEILSAFAAQFGFEWAYANERSVFEEMNSQMPGVWNLLDEQKQAEYASTMCL